MPAKVAVSLFYIFGDVSILVHSAHLVCVSICLK